MNFFEKIILLMIIKTFLWVMCIYRRSIGKSPRNLAYGAGAGALLCLPMIYMIAPDHALFGITEINTYVLLVTYAGVPLAYRWAKKADELRLYGAVNNTNAPA